MTDPQDSNGVWFSPFSTSITLPQPIGQRSHVVSIGHRKGSLSVSNPSAPIIQKVGKTIWEKVASNRHRRVKGLPASLKVVTTQALMHDGENPFNRLKTLADATGYPPRKKGEKMAAYRAVSNDAIFSFMSIQNIVTGSHALTSSTTMTNVTLTVSDYTLTAAQEAVNFIREDPNHVIYHIPGRLPPIQPQRMINHASVVKTQSERKQLKRLGDHAATRIHGSPEQLAALVRPGVMLRMHMQFTFHASTEKSRSLVPKTSNPDLDNCASGAKILIPEVSAGAITSFSADKRVMRTPKLECIDVTSIAKNTAAGVLIYFCKA